ncbi:MAG: hypothetical protein WBV39_07015, partial [Rudaea sp.]
MHSAPFWFAVFRRTRVLSCTLLFVFLSVVFVDTLHAAPPFPQNLGNGLDKLVQTKVPAYFNSGVEAQGTAMAALAITDDQGRVLVRVNPSAGSAKKPAIKISSLRNSLAASIPSFRVTAVDLKYHGLGVMDAFVALEDVTTVATFPGVRSVILELKPYHHRARGTSNHAAESSALHAVSGDTFTKIGTAFDQGVTQHRVDQINQYYNPSAAVDYEGQGMSIGFLSDSYANITTSSRSAARDVTNFDLPGDAGNPVNTQPVVVLQDYTSGGTDEGRAMVQIGYKMAPKARLAFASADFGEVGFADNIRALAGIPGYTYDDAIQQGFAADTICDDVGYYDEPYFQDGIIGMGINDAADYGVAYFSSAGNDIGINGYESDLRWVPNGSGLTAADNTALAGTNIDLTGVPPELYAGGFHNFNPVPWQLDVAQTVNASNSVLTVLQWNDPYDQNTTPIYVQPPIFTGNGTITNSTPVDFTVPAVLAQGTLYELDANADPGSGVDVTVTIKDPDGNTIVSQDNTVDEVVRFFAPVTGANYTISIGRYASTIGPFHITLYETTGFPAGTGISTDVNLLVFRADTGAFLPNSSLDSNNFATNEP